MICFPLVTEERLYKCSPLVDPRENGESQDEARLACQKLAM